MVEQINKFNVFVEKGRKPRFYTKSVYKGYKGFAERIDIFNSEEYREVMPDRSKFIAAIANGLSQTGIKPGSIVLYLGASHGYTASFVSDIVGRDGAVFCVEFAPVAARDLVFVCEKRDNMIPIVEDAAHPENYSDIVSGADAVFQDISQRNQVEIFLRNCDAFLKPGGFGLIAVKARSIDVTRKPRDVFADARKELEKRMAVVDARSLEPHEKDHAFFVLKKK